MNDLRHKRDAVTHDATARADRPILVKLAEIDAALDRLDSGTYGFCDSCAEPIAICALENNPAVLLCGACISKH
jgi:RNA polymerase-binding transcription factor DksA